MPITLTTLFCWNNSPLNVDDISVSKSGAQSIRQENISSVDDEHILSPQAKNKGIV